MAAIFYSNGSGWWGGGVGGGDGGKKEICTKGVGDGQERKIHHLE